MTPTPSARNPAPGSATTPRSRAAPARRGHAAVVIVAMLVVALLAGCAATPTLRFDPRPSAGHYHGGSLKVLHEIMPPGSVDPEADTLDLLRAFEQAQGIDPQAILRAAFHRHFNDIHHALRGPHQWTLQIYTHGLATPDPYTELLKPVLGVTLTVTGADGDVRWHGIESVGAGNASTLFFTPDQLRDDPSLLRAAWVAAAELVMQRLQSKYRAGVRDRREGYAD
jgi:hypothetical protein